MRLDQWRRVAVVLENAWRGDWDDARSASYFALLEPFEVEQVEQALHVIVRNGKPFLPTVPEIIAAIDAASTVQSSTWDECWLLVRRVIKRRGRRGAEKALEDLRSADPLVASWVGVYGWDRLCAAEVEHPQYGPATLVRLRESWDAHVERHRDRDHQALALTAVGRRSLSGPRKVDAARALREAVA